MSRAKLFVVVLAISALFTAAPVLADTVLFQDGFESQPVGSVSHVAGPDAVTNGVPVSPPTGLAWDKFTVGSYLPDIQVTDYATPGASTGSNYLRLRREGNPNTAPSYGEVEAKFPMQSTAGDTVRVEADVRIPTLADRAIQLYGMDMNPNEVDNYNLVAASDGSVYAGTGIHPTVLAAGSITAGVWQHWTVDFHIGGTYDLAIGSASATGLTAGGTGNINYAVFDCPGYGAEAFVDNVKVTLNPSAVPEPSSMVLVISAVLGLAAYAWRKRK